MLRWKMITATMLVTLLSFEAYGQEDKTAKLVAKAQADISYILTDPSSAQFRNIKTIDGKGVSVETVIPIYRILINQRPKDEELPVGTDYQLAREQWFERSKSHAYAMAEWGYVCGEVNAKNQFGGYVGFQPFIYIPAPTASRGLVLIPRICPSLSDP